MASKSLSSRLNAIEAAQGGRGSLRVLHRPESADPAVNAAWNAQHAASLVRQGFQVVVIRQLAGMMGERVA